MKNVIIDSSVWISYFIKEDQLHQKADNLISLLLEQKEITILVPDLIFAEITNQIYKLTNNFNLIEKIRKIFFNQKKFSTIHGDENFWFNFIYKNSQKYNLKTADLIIASYYNYLQADNFYTFDKKLLKQINNPLIII